ncbi:MAG: HAD hydrolase family protein [Pseudomonadota bacterium]
MPAGAPVDDLLANTRLLSLDVDGVLTDGRIVYTASGDEIKAFHAQDGLALKLLADTGVKLAIISGRASPIVERRARELGIDACHLGVADKLSVLGALCDAQGVTRGEIAHIGDDINDLPLMAAVGCGLSVANGHPSVRAAAAGVSRAAGGAGAVREWCVRIMQAQGNWPYPDPDASSDAAPDD